MSIKNLGRVQGLSAYEIWLQQGNTGTEEDFIKSLIGESGKGIVNIEKTSTDNLIDIYTITYTDNTTDTKNTATIEFVKTSLAAFIFFSPKL